MLLKSCEEEEQEEEKEEKEEVCVGERGVFSQMRQSREGRVACDGNYRVVNVKKTENTGFVCELLKTYSF